MPPYLFCYLLIEGQARFSGIGRVMWWESDSACDARKEKRGPLFTRLFKSEIPSVVALYIVASVLYVKTSNYSWKRAGVDFYHMREKDKILRTTHR